MKSALLLLLLLGLLWSAHSSVAQQEEKTCPNPEEASCRPLEEQQPQNATQECGLWIASSTLPNSGLGMFAGKTFEKGSMVGADHVIPLTDLRRHQGTGWPFLWYSYTWSSAGTLLELEADDVDMVSPGFGSVANALLDMANTDLTNPQLVPTAPAADPTMGSYSPYHHRQATAMKDILPGEEIFVNYGEDWFQRRNKWPNLVANGRDLKQDFLGQSTTWLAEHGTCADHIVDQPSTLGGRGAFARRFLPRGSIVALLPLVHIPYRTRLDLYDLETTDDHDQQKVAGMQLLLNYCFGHDESTLLLCPYGHLNTLINHASSASDDDRKEPNVKLQWSTLERGNHHKEWLHLSLPELDRQKQFPGLAFDLVAIRDIDEGEEILLDYGNAWEAAWRRHKRRWKNPRHASYVSPQEWNAKLPQSLSQDCPPHLQLHVNLAFAQLATADELDWRKRLRDDKNLTQDFLNLKLLPDNNYVPCRIVNTHNNSGHDESLLYDVELITGLVIDQHQGTMSSITGLPHQAFVFYYKEKYYSDIFAPNAFRHDMRIPDKLFPRAWRNLKKS